MTKIIRPSKNIVAFGSNAEGTERTTFGTTTQANDLDSNLNDSFARGWGIVAGSDLPTKQDFNAMGYTLGQLNAYLYQMGIAEYDEAQEYHLNSFTNYNGIIYKSLTNNNVGNPPNTSTTNWESVIDGKYLPLTGGTLSGDLTAPNITASTSLTVSSAKATYSATGLNFDKPLLINGASVLKVGDGGLLSAGQLLTNLDDANFVSGFFITGSSTSGTFPTSETAKEGSCIFVKRTPGKGSQLFLSAVTNRIYLRGFHDSKFSSWQELITTANVSSYQGLGYGQTWQDVLSSRQYNTVYTNSTSKPIAIAVSTQFGDGGSDYYIYVDDLAIASCSTQASYSQGNMIFGIVPAGSTYKVTGSRALKSWNELR